MANPLSGRLNQGLAGLFQQKDPLQEAIQAMKTQGGSLGNVRKFIANLQKAATPQERQAAYSQEFSTLLPSEQAVAGLMLQNMMKGRPGGLGFPSAQERFAGAPEPVRGAFQQEMLGTAPQVGTGELPLRQLAPGRADVPFGPARGPRDIAAGQRLGRLTERFPLETHLPEVWREKLGTMGTAEVLPRKEAAMARAKETGELDDVINEFKKWQKEGYMIDQAEQAAEVARKTLGPYGVDLTQVLLEEYVDPEWMRELDGLDPSKRQLLGLYKDERGRTKWRPSEDEATRIKQGALLQIARTPTPTWKDVRNWNSSAQLDIFLVTFGIPGVEGEEMAQKLFEADKITLQEMPYIAKPLVKRESGSQEYIDGIVALQVMLMPEQIKFIEWLAKNPDQRAAYIKLVDNILIATGKKSIKKYLEDMGMIAKPTWSEKLTKWMYKEKE